MAYRKTSLILPGKSQWAWDSKLEEITFDILSRIHHWKRAVIISSDTILEDKSKLYLESVLYMCLEEIYSFKTSDYSFAKADSYTFFKGIESNGSEVFIVLKQHSYGLQSMVPEIDIKKVAKIYNQKDIELLEAMRKHR